MPARSSDQPSPRSPQAGVVPDRVCGDCARDPQSFLSDVIPNDIQGTGLGMVRTTSATFGVAGPVLFGGLADLGYFHEGYVLLFVILLVVIGLTLRLPKPTA